MIGIWLALPLHTRLLYKLRAHPTCAVSVHPRLAAKYLIRSTIDISPGHSRQQENSNSKEQRLVCLLPVALSVASMSMVFVQVQMLTILSRRLQLMMLLSVITVSAIVVMVAVMILPHCLMPHRFHEMQKWRSFSFSSVRYKHFP